MGPLYRSLLWDEEKNSCVQHISLGFQTLIENRGCGQLFLHFYLKRGSWIILTSFWPLLWMQIPKQHPGPADQNQFQLNFFPDNYHILSPQSRQSAKLFLQSSELGLPPPLTRRRVCPPPPPVPGEGAHSLAREGLGESQFWRRDLHCGTLYIHTYFVYYPKHWKFWHLRRADEKDNTM